MFNLKKRPKSIKDLEYMGLSPSAWNCSVA